MHEKIYGVKEAKEGEQKDEESKKEDPNKGKGKKKVGFSKPSNVKVIRLGRGGKKAITMITGLESFGVNLKDISKVMGKKFACGASISQDIKYGEGITVQGDVQDRFFEFVESDLKEFNISDEQIELVDGGNKKKNK